MKDILKIWVKDKYILSIWLLCLFILTSVWVSLAENEVTKKIWLLIEPIKSKLLLSLIILSISLALTCYCIYKKLINHMKIEINVEDYELYQTSNGLAFYKIKNDIMGNGTWFCTNCMDIHRKASIVHENYRDGKYPSWFCPNCKTHLESFKYDRGNDGSLV